VGDSEGGIVIWDTQTWKETKSIVKGTGVIRYVGLDRTGERLIAETESGLVLWNLAGDDEIGVVGERFLFGSSFCFSDDQRHFATGGDGSVVIHDANTGKKVREISHATHTMQLCFSSDSQLIASGLRGVPLNKHCGVFDVATGKAIFDHAEHGKGVTGVVFLDDNKCLLSTAADGTLKFWHVPSGTELLRMKLADSIYQPSCHVKGSTILWNQRSGPRYFTFK
jgi:WD40 repeat protein